MRPGVCAIILNSLLCIAFPGRACRIPWPLCAMDASVEGRSWTLQGCVEMRYNSCMTISMSSQRIRQYQHIHRLLERLRPDGPPWAVVAPKSREPRGDI